MDVVFRESMVLFAIIALLPLLLFTVAGLLVGVLQAATQIQEQSISFAVKVILAAVCCLIGAPFALRFLVSFLERMYVFAAVSVIT